MGRKTVSVTIAFSVLVAAVQAAYPRFCAAGTKDMAKCDKWSEAMKSTMNFTCVSGKDAADCYMKIAKQEADIGMFDGGEIYDAGKAYNMKVIAYEHRKTSPDTYINYYAVAVVKKNSNLTMATLKGSKSCHTGYGKTSGWKVPMGYLLEKGYMKWEGCDQFATAAKFFSKSCVPGAKGKASNLCALCNGTGADNCDKAKDPYSNYRGAFNCLKHGAGDVAFIKESIVPSAEKADYKLLCPDTSKTTDTLANVKTCNLAKAPAHGVLARNDDPKINISITLLKSSSDKFNKILFDGNGIFSDSTDSIKEVANARQPYDKYLDSNYMEVVSKLEGCKMPSKAWCTTGAASLIMASVSIIMALIMP